MVSYAIKELRRHKGRTIANIIGYASAVSFMVILVSFVQFQNRAAVSTLKGIGTHFVAYLPESTCSCDFMSGAPAFGPCIEGVRTSVIDASVVETIRSQPGIRVVTPYIRFKTYDQNYNSIFTIGGIDPTSLATHKTVCSPKNVVKGRYLTTSDRDAVLLDQPFARAIDLDVNDSITALGHNFKIVGIVAPPIRPGKANMYAPIDVVREGVQLESTYFGPGDMNIVLVEVTDARMQEQAFESVRRVLGNCAISSYGCYSPAREVIGTTGRMLWGIFLITVIFVVVFALKSQLAAVVERTREIGILKTIGWTDSNVVAQVLTESVIQGLIGGVVGCCLGILVILLLPSTGLISGGIPSLSLLAIGAGLAISLICAVLAGIFPAWAAAKLQPADALRRF